MAKRKKRLTSKEVIALVEDAVLRMAESSEWPDDPDDDDDMPSARVALLAISPDDQDVVVTNDKRAAERLGCRRRHDRRPRQKRHEATRKNSRRGR